MRCEEIKPVFLYGLFMDMAILKDMGLSPVVIGKAVLNDYRIQIAGRAAVYPAQRSKVYGVLAQLNEDELNELYSAPSVAAYQPEEVDVVLMASDRVESAVVYNLLGPWVSDSRDQSYADSLAKLVRRLGFPVAYAEEIAAGAAARLPELPDQ